MEEIIVISDLKKRYKLSRKQQRIERTGEKIKVALQGLSFSVRKGEIYALLGPNGAGKTTTLRILATLINPDDGNCQINGVSVIENPHTVRNMIGFLTTDLKLDDYFTPNYLFDFFSELYGVEKEKIIDRKKYLYGIFNIDNFAEVKLSDLSTGMKQKVAIAVSLVHDPEIIIFDEPTNGLDIVTEKVVIDFLIEEKRKGKTIIISTHILGLVEKIADRVGIIINGKMIKEDSLSNIIGNRNLEQVFYDTYVSVMGENDEEN